MANKIDPAPSKPLTRKQKKDLGFRIWSTTPGLEVVHRDAVGIDIGGREHYAAVRPDRDAEPVRTFGCFTADLHGMAAWFKECGLKTIRNAIDRRLLDSGLRHTGTARLRRVASQCARDPQSTWAEERCAGKPMVTQITHLRLITKSVPSALSTPRDS